MVTPEPYEKEALFGRSAVRRTFVFASAPIAVAAGTLAAMLAVLDGDLAAAAFVGPTVMIAAALTLVAAPLVRLAAKGSAAMPGRSYFMALRVVIAAMFVGVLASAFGTGWALAGRVQALAPAAGIVIAFSAGVLYAVARYARWAFGLHPAASIALAAAQSACLAASALAAWPLFAAVLAACTAALVAYPFFLIPEMGS